MPITPTDIFLRKELTLRSCLAMLTLTVGLCFVLTGCRRSLSDYEPDAAPGAISFESVRLEEETGAPARRTPADSDHPLSAARRVDRDAEEFFHSFRVWGWKNGSLSADTYGDVQTVFPGYAVRWSSHTANTTESNTADWEYVDDAAGQTIKYWDLSAPAYRFVGCAPADADATVDMSDPSRSVMTLRLDPDAAVPPMYSHMWFGATKSNINTAVRLEFVRPYCQVVVKLIDPFGNPLEQSEDAVEVSSMRFAPTDNSGIALRGSVSVTCPLVGTATTETVVFHRGTAEGDLLPALTEPYVDNIGYFSAWLATTGRVYMLIPAAQGSYTLTLRIGGDDRTAVVPDNFMQWKTNNLYTYIFKVAIEPKELTFETVVKTKWQAGYIENTTW